MSRPLRIGIVTDGLEERPSADGVEVANGGVGVYIYHLLRELRRIDDPNQYVLIRYGGARLDVYEENERFRVVTLPRTSFHRYGRWIDVPYHSLARKERLDLVHYPNQFGGAFLPSPPRRVVTLHDLTPLLFPKFHPWRSVAGYRWLLRRSLWRADRVIVDAEATRSDLLRRGLAGPDQVIAIPLGVDERFRPGIRTEGFAERYDLPRRFLLSVGVLEPRKNHAVLLDALRLLGDQAGELGLVIAGRDGWRWRNPLDEPRHAPLRDRVRILRNLPDRDLPELYGRAEALVYPSLYEGFGLPVLGGARLGNASSARRRSVLVRASLVFRALCRLGLRRGNSLLPARLAGPVGVGMERPSSARETPEAGARGGRSPPSRGCGRLRRDTRDSASARM